MKMYAKSEFLYTYPSVPTEPHALVLEQETE